MRSVITDPSLDHLDKKIFAWLLATVLIGLVAGITLSAYEDKAWRNARYRSIRAPRTIGRPLRKRSLCLVN